VRKMPYFLFVMCHKATPEDIEILMQQEGIVGHRLRRDGTFEIIFPTHDTCAVNTFLPDDMKVYFVPESQYPVMNIKL